MCSSSKRKRINVEDKDKKGRTPFHYACNNGHLEIAGGTREVALLQGLEIPTCRSIDFQKRSRNYLESMCVCL